MGSNLRASMGKLRDSIAIRARAVPAARHAWARYRRRRYERQIERFLREKTGRADRLPVGAVYEATMHVPVSVRSDQGFCEDSGAFACGRTSPCSGSALTAARPECSRFSASAS